MLYRYERISIRISNARSSAEAGEAYRAICPARAEADRRQAANRPDLGITRRFAPARKPELCLVQADRALDIGDRAVDLESDLEKVMQLFIKIIPLRAGTAEPAGQPCIIACPAGVEPDTILSFLTQHLGEVIETIWTSTERHQPGDLLDRYAGLRHDRNEAVPQVPGSPVFPIPAALQISLDQRCTWRSIL